MSDILGNKPSNIFINIVFSLPNTLYRARSAAWFGFSIVSRTDLRSAWIRHHAERVQYVVSHEITFS